MDRRQFVTALTALAVFCSALATASDGPPPPPATATVSPIHLDKGTSQPIAFMGAIFRIPTGAKIGTTYLGSEKRDQHELRWDRSSGRTHEFDIATNDRLREMGYAVVDSMATAFEDKTQEKSRLQLAVVVTRMQSEFHLKRDYWAMQISDQSYGTAELDMEVELQDADTQKMLYQTQFHAWGIDHGKNPVPIVPAFLNGIDHALSDAQFVAAIRKPDGAAPGPVVSGQPIAVPHCEVDPALHLPDKAVAVTDAVVSLKAGNSFGSGVIVSPTGLVLTAAHVVSGRQTLVVRLKSGVELDAPVLRADASRDVAILQLPGRGFPCLAISRELPAVGSDIFAVGTPMDPRLMNSVSRGIVSGLREIEGEHLIQTDAALNPGTSGGPLVDNRGQVRALVSRGLVGVGVEGLAFGVPIDVVVSRLALEIR